MAINNKNNNKKNTRKSPEPKSLKKSSSSNKINNNKTINRNVIKNNYRPSNANEQENIFHINSIPKNSKISKNAIRRQALQSKKIQPKKKRKNRNNVLVARLVTFFLFFFIISYFSISIYKSLNKEPIKFETIVYGTIDNQKTARGIIIRDETLYNSSKNGVLSFVEQEYEKIKKGKVVASVKDQLASQDTQVELAEINEKILEIQKNRDELSLFSEEVKKVDLQIQNVLENGAFEFSQNDVSYIYEIKNNVDKKIEIRNKMLLSENIGSVSELSNVRSIKQNEINSNTQDIPINESGILSYYTDGLEQQFNFENIDNITKEQVKTQFDKDDSFSHYKMNVQENEPIFKIVESNAFYIATYIKTDYITDWKEGDTKTIYVSDAGEYTPQEVKIQKLLLDKKETYVLMKSTKNILDFINKRNIVFEINKPKKGLKINNTAIAERNLLKIPTDYVSEGIITKKTENGTKKIVVENDEINEVEGIMYVPIEYGEIKTGDTIINPTNNQEYVLNDVYTSKGIFIVNSGVYEFRKINLENSVSNQDFTILDPDFNQNIKLYDRFIPEQKHILKEEPIYK